MHVDYSFRCPTSVIDQTQMETVSSKTSCQGPNQNTQNQLRSDHVNKFVSKTWQLWTHTIRDISDQQNNKHASEF